MHVLLCFQLTRDVDFNRDNYYLPRGQLVSLNLDEIFLPSLFKILPCYEVFLVT